MTSTLFAAFYGAFSARYLDPNSDAYSLFYARSAAMGWLTEAVGGSDAVGIWGMNDAGSVATDDGRFAFFQAALTQPTHDGSAPIMQFLDVAWATTERLGEAQLRGAHLLVPLPGSREEQSAAFSPGDLAEVRVRPAVELASRWFVDSGVATQVAVHVTLDSGKDLTARAGIEELVEWINAARQNTFTATHFSLADADHVNFEESRLHASDGSIGLATIVGFLSEWTMDAIGWTAAFLAEGVKSLGGNGTLRIDIRLAS